MKIQTFMRVLKGSQATLDVLSQAGVDVKILSKASSTKGPRGDFVKGVISVIAGIIDPHPNHLEILAKEARELSPTSLPSEGRSRTKRSKKRLE
jgi:hypothetical protein